MSEASTVTAAPDPVVDVVIPRVDGRFQLVISNDGLFAHAKRIVPASGGGRPITANDIALKLKRLKVKHGIRRETVEALIARIDAGEEPAESVVVAEGDAVQHGDDAAIEWCVGDPRDSPAPTIVPANTDVAIRKAATPGEAGRKVHGGVIRPRPGIDEKLETGQGVEVRTGGAGARIFRSRHAGELRFESGSVSVDPHVVVSDDEMQVHMDIPVRSSGEAEQAFTADDIAETLVCLGVKHGVLAGAIQSTLIGAGASQAFVENVLVAEGTAPVHGAAPGLVVDRELLAGEHLDNGKIDFHERSYPWNVAAGQVIGSVTPYQPPADGATVRGAPLVAKRAADTPFALDGIESGDDGVLRALRNGVLLINGRDLKVSDSLVINDDVGQRTGNVHADSAVIVNGHIQPGFTLEANGDAVVRDNIENGSVIASGSVVVQAGVRGASSKIHSGGNISATFIETAKLVANGDITGNVSIIGCTIRCEGFVRVGDVHSTHSALIGGTTRAAKGVEAAVLGSQGCNKTVVAVGLDADQVEHVEALGAKLAAAQHKLEGLRKVREHFRQNPSLGQDELLEKVVNTEREVEQEREQTQLAYTALEAKIKEARGATVVVHRRVFPGVHVQIMDETFEVVKELGAGTFRLNRDRVVFQPG